MLLSAVSVLVVAQSSSEVPEGLMNNPVYIYIHIYIYILLSCIIGDTCIWPNTVLILEVRDYSYLPGNCPQDSVLNET